MSTSSVAVPSYPAAAVPRAVNPWIVALAVVIPTFMEVLDTTIANVALRHIAGGLSAAVTDGEWVITSYLAANAIILPASRLQPETIAGLSPAKICPRLLQSVCSTNQPTA